MFSAGNRFGQIDIFCNFCYKYFRQETGKDTYKTFHKHLIENHADKIENKYKCKFCQNVSLTIKANSEHKKICEDNPKNKK